jgi:hypothetical protein
VRRAIGSFIEVYANAAVEESVAKVVRAVEARL